MIGDTGDADRGDRAGRGHGMKAVGARALSDKAEAKATRSQSQVQVIARAAAILRALEDEAAGLSLGQIAQRVNLARSTVQRIVAALEAEKFLIAASPTGRVRLGPTILRLAASARTDFVAVARPYLTQLSSELKETVDLSVVKKDHLIFIDQVIGSQRLRTVSAVGETFPLHCTANGKALLSVLPEEKLNRLLKGPLARMTPSTITRAADLMKEIEACRRTGIAVDNQEHTEGISALGTGFMDPMGRAIALSIPVPTTRFKRTHQALAAHLLAAREQILESLGGSTH